MELNANDVLSNEEKLEIFSERLRKRDEDRIAKSEKSRTEKENKTADREQARSFEVEFQRAKSEIVSQLQSCSELASEKLAMTKHLDKIAETLQVLQKLVTDSQIFLSTYEKRITNEMLNSLQESLKEMQNKFLPRQRFAFKTRRKEAEKKDVKGKDETDRVAIPLPTPTNECGFMNRTGEELSKTAEEVEGKDVELHRLKDCTVCIRGNPSTVHITGLSNCVVQLGPVLTSVFVDDCERVTFRLACQQLRIHSSSRCTFYVHVTSRSIIEDSKELHFAPYNWRYEGIDKDFESASMDPAISNWKSIDDFNWLALDVQSPNWSILEENERTAVES